MEPAISFITAMSKGRESQVEGFIYTLSSRYENYEVIIANQVDEGLVRIGQLRNLGYKKSVGELVVFIDIDIRLLEYIDFVKAMDTYQRPLIMFNKSFEIVEKVLGEYILHPRGGFVSHCVGRLLCFTREQFEACGGYSNLCLGWGWEDNVLCERAKLKKIPGKIGHINHKWERGAVCHQKINKAVFKTDWERLATYDGIFQTIAEEIEEEKLAPHITRYDFSNITVPKNFEYNYLLKEHETYRDNNTNQE
jgi:hypothetical protein